MRRFFSSSPIALRKRIPSLSSVQPIDMAKYRAENQAKSQETLDNATSGGPPGAEPKDEGLIKSFLYGSPKAKTEASEIERSFSQQLMRGKFVHSIEIHDVIPAKSPEYTELVGKVYPKFNQDPSMPVKLMGSWRTVIGDMDRFVHIWQYEGYAGYHNALVAAHQQDEYLDYLGELRSTLRSRNTQIVQEFGSWGGTAEPRQLGGVFELRKYELKPGKMLEWETNWQRGIQVRRQVMEPVGAWFSQVGPLNHVFHLWQFADLEQRKLARQKSWELEGWAETTHQTVELIQHMESQIMVPMPFSPLK